MPKNDQLSFRGSAGGQQPGEPSLHDPKSGSKLVAMATATSGWVVIKPKNPRRQAIEDGDVPRPGLLGYHDWNSWRANDGLRPSKIRHGDEETTTTAEEAQLWRNVMEALYGPDWKDQLASRGGQSAEEDDEEEDEEEEEEDEASEELQSEEEEEDEASEELQSVEDLGRREAGPAPETGVEDRRVAPAAPSRASSTESPQKYAKRLYRLAEALDLEGEPVNDKDVERRAARALYEFQVHGKPEEEQLALLKESFRELEEEYKQRLDILMAMIQGRGGRLSKAAEKLFSSTENTPEKAPKPKSSHELAPSPKAPAAPGRGERERKDPDRERVSTKPSLREVADLKRRVSDLEGDARSEGSRLMDPIATFAEALEKQTQVMAEALTKKTKRSTIQVSPKVSWPMLDDDCSDYRSVQEFYDTFEATIGLANDGEGMTDMEKLTTLKACLKQHRLKTYELVKIGPTMSKEVRRDKRFRPDGVGGTKFRGVATWEEAHEVVKELEETAAGQRALNNSTFAHGSGRDKSTKTKGADKIHAQEDSSSNRIEQELKRVCFDMRDRGTCSRGKECKYSHDRAVVDEARRRQVRDKKSGQQDKNRAAKVDDHAKRGTGPGLQLANAADLTGMKQEGSGMSKDNPFVGCFDTAVLDGGGVSVKTEPVLATKPEEVVMGLANGAPIKLKGAAVLRVTFPDVGGKKAREVLVRAKVIANGGSTWHGLILGGRALDAVERGGLGFRPGATAHIFDGLGLRLPRKEDMEEYTDHAYPYVAVQASLFDRAWGMDTETIEEQQEVQGDLLKFTGEERWIGEEGDWVPVRREGQKELPPGSCISPVEVVLPLAETGLEVVPGLWSADQAEGLVYVTPKEQEIFISEGDEIGVVTGAIAEQQFCRSCGHFDAAAWVGSQGSCEK
eukprot:s165_g17.t1